MESFLFWKSKKRVRRKREQVGGGGGVDWKCVILSGINTFCAGALLEYNISVVEMVK